MDHRNPSVDLSVHRQYSIDVTKAVSCRTLVTLDWEGGQDEYVVHFRTSDRNS